MSDLDTVVQQALDKLATDPDLDGYTLGYPNWGLLGDGGATDRHIAATTSCLNCGHNGREHAGFVAADGSHSWRGFAICPSCGHTEEF
jgi:hypothetical protein